MSGKSLLLISANVETSPTVVYPIGLSYLAGKVVAAGHRVRQFDVLVDNLDTLPKVIEETVPDLIGVSLRNVDNTESRHPQWYMEGYERLIRKIRQATTAPVVLGGSGYSLFPRRMLKELGADFGIVGPGGGALCELLANIDSSETLAKLSNVLRADNLERVDAAPAQHSTFSQISTTAIHDSRLVEFYWKTGGMIGIQTKRGCHRRCIYCTYPLIEGNTVQWASVDEVVDEIQRLTDAFGVQYFFFVDSLFNQSRYKEIELAEEIIRRKLNIFWGAFFSPMNLDDEYLAILTHSGLKHVEFGTDSLSDKVLQGLHKDFTVEEVFEASALCTKQKLYCAHYIIFGGVGENLQTIEETMRNSSKLDNCVFFPFAGLRIYPQTDLYNLACKQSIINFEQECYEPTFYFAPGLTDERIWGLVQQSQYFNKRWALPHKMEQMNRYLKRARLHGANGPLWERLLS